MEPWSTALPDWEKRIMAGQSLVPDLPLFQEEAAKALRVFKRLRIPDVIGTPTMAEACGEWYFPIVEALFGCYDPETHRRMIQEFFQLIPKKNGKSSNGGAVMLTATILNRRPEAEFMFVAPTVAIANISFKQASGTIRLDPELEKLFQIRNHIRTIENRKTGAQLQIKAADTDVVTGGKQTGTMIDETHVFAKRSNAKDVFVELRGALTARPDGFLFQTTTQSKEPPDGVFKSELEKARRVRDGKRKFPLLPILYEYPEKLVESGKWKDRKYWQVVNPNLGRSVEVDFLERELETAEDEGKDQFALIASQHWNVEIGLRLRADRWPGADYWENAVDAEISLQTLIDRCDVIVVGIDGGGLDDLLGLTALGRCKITREWLAWCKAWCQPDVLKLRKEIAPKLQDFDDDGDLVICREPTQDVEEVADIVEEIRDAGLLPEKAGVGLDAVGVAQIVDELAERDITNEQMVAVPQGYRLNGAIKGAERKLKDGTLWHSGSRLMNWCVGNAKVEQRGNATLITKQAAGKAKIDPLTALFNAVQLMARNPEAGVSVVTVEDSYQMSA